MEEGLLDTQTRMETTFFQEGFSNWKKATEKFSKHQNSDCHSHAVLKLHLKQSRGVVEGFALQNSRSQATAQKLLTLLFSSALYLGKQGFPFRGHEHDDGAFHNLVLERAKADNLHEVVQFIKRKDNWMSYSIQNEIIDMFGRQVLEEIMQEAQEADFVGLVADGTTDIGGKEQFSVCLQYLDQQMTPTTSFVGFYDAPSSSGETLTLIIQDVLVRLNIPVVKLSGFSFDNASNMSGVHQGVQSRLKALNSSAIYVPCSNHSLDLVLQEAGREVMLIADCLSFVKDVANTINESAKRSNLYKSLFKEGEVVQKPLGICATRWCVRAKAMKRMLDQYGHVRDVLQSLEEDHTVRGEMRAKIAGLSRKADEAPTYISLTLSLAIFQPCEVVARTLQGSSNTARSVLETIQALKSRLQCLRDGGLVDETRAAAAKAKQMDLTMPPPRRRRYTPAKVRHDERSAEDLSVAPVEGARLASLEALDLVIGGLETRFDSDGLQAAASRERLVLGGCSKQSSAEFDALQLPASIDEERLECQLNVLTAGFKKPPTSLQELCEKLSSMDPKTKPLFSEVRKLLGLIMSLPCTVACAERSFSMLRRLKTYLRSTTGQSRLNGLALMNAHKNRLEGVDLAVLKSRFVERTAERMSTFGRC